MGALCGSPSSRRDAEIDDYQHKQFKAENQVIRTLLLGTGATGKSTLFQSFQLAKEGAIPIQDRLKMRHTIRCNIIYGMYTLIEQSEKLYAIDPIKFENCQLFPNNNNNNNNSDNIDNNNEEYSKELREKIDFIRRFYIDLTYITDESGINFDEFGDAATIVLYLWNLDSIQNTFKNRCKYFAFDDNLPYFFENVESIMNSDYVPSEEHVLKNRARSTGLARYEYILQTNAPSVSHNQIKVEVLDVGGQRNERRKWIHYFEDVSGVIFVASLIDHNGVLFEASNMNALKESLNLFNKITALKWFQKSEIILFLNKDDLLRKLLQTKENGLSICFNNNDNSTGGANNDNNFFEWNENEIWDSSIDSQYYDNNSGLFLHDNDNSDNNNEMKMMEGVETSNKFEEYHDKVVTFMANLFLTRNKSTNQKLTVHVTTALHNIAVHKVFETVHKSIVLNNLKRVGIYQNKSKLNNNNNNNNNNINIGNSQGFNNNNNNNNNSNNIMGNDISRNDNVMTGSKSNHSSTSIGAIISSSSPSNHDTNSMMIITDHTSNSNNTINDNNDNNNNRNRNDRADTLSVNETNTNGNSGNIYGDIDNEIENDTGVDSGIDNDNNDNNDNNNNNNDNNNNRNKMDKPNSLKAQLRVASTSRGSIDESNTNTNTNNEMMTMQTHLDLNVIDNNNE